jgi:hypothetical protein
MPPWLIYDYLHPTHGNLMRQWCSSLQKKERAKLDQKIDALSLHGKDLIPGIVVPTGEPCIYKLKVQGQVKLRPMLCEGPGNEQAFTFLLGAREISWAYEPSGAPKTAGEYRDDLMRNPTRRTLHDE